MVTSLAVLLCMLISAVAVDLYFDFNPMETPNENVSSDALSVELINTNAVLISDGLQRYLAVDLLSPQNESVLPSQFLKAGELLAAQNPVSLKFSVKEANVVTYQIEYADNSLFENARIGYATPGEGKYTFEHLYANTTYYYRVTAYTTTGVVTKNGQFQTADTPRILSVDGATNLRDIGNWKTDSGKRIKQGLLLRGTELDGAVEPSYHLTNKGVVDMLEVFGIKTDIDLRAKTPDSKDALGARVQHNYYDMVMYAEIFTDAGKDKIKAVFTDLSNPANYPIYLHCTYGRDRTGTVCYLLEAVLGVSRGDCLKEYSLSNCNISNILAVEKGLDAYGGSSLKENAELYLKDCGITDTQIQTLRQIFLGE